MEITGVLVKIAKVLEDLEIPYAVTGGVAVTVWGRARYTADIDIVIDIAPQKFKQLIAKLSEIDSNVYLNVEKDDLIENKKMFNLIHSNSGVKADFIVKKDDEFSQVELQRVIKKDFNGQEIRFISPEDLILNKLLWYKKCDSDRHLEDIESVLKISEVDLGYIKDWAKKQETLNILDELLEKLDK